jgi:hypothetical protein
VLSAPSRAGEAPPFESREGRIDRLERGDVSGSRALYRIRADSGAERSHPRFDFGQLRHVG